MRTSAIRDLVEVRGGGTPRKADASYFGGGIPWVTPKDMRARTIAESEITLTEAGVLNSPAKVIQPNSVLVVVRSGVLKRSLPVALTTAPVTVNQDMKALTPLNGISGAWLARLVKFQEAAILPKVRATTADNFPIEALLDIRVAVPPLDEQHRIASILDQVDAGRSCRIEVLGRLRSLSSALFETLLASAQPEHRRMEDLIESVRIGLDRPSAEQGHSRAFAYLKMDAVTRDGRLNIDRSTRVDATDNEVTTYSLTDGDLILNTRNSRELVGKSAVYRGGPVLFNNNLARIRFTSDVLPDYVHRFLWSPEGRSQLDRRKSGTTNVFAMYAKDFKTITVPVVPIEVQRAYAERVAAIDVQIFRVQRAIDLHDELFASLQSRAFKDEL